MQHLSSFKVLGLIWTDVNSNSPCLVTVTCCVGVGAMTWSPLACGLITGKYSDGVPDCSRAAMKVSPKEFVNTVLEIFSNVLFIWFEIVSSKSHYNHE